MSQSLFYWIIYSYEDVNFCVKGIEKGLNPYFIGLSTLMGKRRVDTWSALLVSILILLDYLLLFLHQLINPIRIRMVSILILLDYLLL